MTNYPDLSEYSLVLASSSPRRSELLSSVGLLFDVLPAEVDERLMPGEHPQVAAERLAEAKAHAIGRRVKQAVVLGADTVVAVADAAGSFQILGKPVDEEDARAMLRKLQGREHLVVTAFSVVCAAASFVLTRSHSARVWMRMLSEKDISAYTATGEPMDKAGAYAVQGIGRMLVLSIDGSYTGVMGLPLAEVVVELERLNLWRPEMLAKVRFAL